VWAETAHGTITSLLVNYYAKTWSRTVQPTTQVPSAGCTLTLSSPDWPATIRRLLACGELVLDGRSRIEGVTALRLGENKTGVLSVTLWVNANTYAPVQLTISDHGVAISQVQFQWLAPTPAMQRKLARPPVPAGFRQFSGKG
jgi:hypothetical protein